MGKESSIYLKTLLFLILIWLAFFFFIYYKEFGIAYNSELGNYMSGVFAPISALGTIFITFLIYKMSSVEKRADEDFRLIAGLYFKIQETYELLKKQNLPTNFLDSHNSYYERQLKVDCLLLLNYIMRYPQKRCNTNKLEEVIMGIYTNPNYESDYIELAEAFQNFCYELNPDWDPCAFKLKKT